MATPALTRSEGQPVTDPELLRQLEGPPVTDPELLRQLEGGSPVTDPELLRQLEGSPVTPAAPDRTQLQAFLRSQALGARGLAEGAIMSVPAMGADFMAALMNLGIRQYNRATGANISEFPPQGEAFGRALTAAGAPEPQTGAERVVYDINRGAGAAAASVGLGGMAGIPAMTQRAGAQIASSAIAGGASGLTREAGGGPGAQLAAGLAAGAVSYAGIAKLADSFLGDMAGANWKPEYRKVMEASQKHKVPLSVGDVTRGDAAKIEKRLGMGAFREAQDDAARAAAQAIKDDLGSGSGPEWAEIARESLKRRAGRMRTQAASMYDEIGQLSADRAVPIGRALDAMDEAIVGSKGAIMDGDTANLERIRERLAQSYRAGNFELLREFRSRLGLAISSSSDRNEIRILTTIKRALEEDMAEFAQKQGGEIWHKWRAADTFYRTELVPARKLAERLGKIEDPDELYRAFLKNATAKPQTLYNAMGPKARDSVRYGLFSEALDKALSESGEVFSPSRLASNLEKISRATGIFFSPEEKEMLDGFAVLMRRIPRVSSSRGSIAIAATAGVTGGTIVSALQALQSGTAPSAALGIGGAAALGIGGATAGMRLAIRKLLTSDTGKRLLLTLSRHPGEADSVLRFYASFLGAASARSGYQPHSAEESQ